MDEMARLYDRHQWIILRAKIRRGRREWQPVAFVASNVRVLRRTLLENGVKLTDAAKGYINAMPERFRDWHDQHGEHKAMKAAA